MHDIIMPNQKSARYAICQFLKLLMTQIKKHALYQAKYIAPRSLTDKEPNTNFVKFDNKDIEAEILQV